MKMFMLVGVGVVVALVATVLAVLIVGALLPVGHVATRSARYSRSPEEIWVAITGFADASTWRSTVKSFERLEDQNGQAVWRENGSTGPLTYVVEELVPPSRLVTRIADPGLPFGGRWIYEVSPADGGASLTITEDGEIYNLIFRFMSRFVFGHTRTMDGYLRDLGRKFGEEVVPQPPDA